MWILFAFLSALFASLMTLFMKMGLKDMNPHVATALRTSIVVLLCWGLVFITKSQTGIKADSKKRMDLFDLSKYSHIWDMDLLFFSIKRRQC